MTLGAFGPSKWLETTNLRRRNLLPQYWQGRMKRVWSLPQEAAPTVYNICPLEAVSMFQIFVENKYISWIQSPERVSWVVSSVSSVHSDLMPNYIS